MLRDQLFVRERHGMRPTPIALALAPAIAETLARLDDVVLVQQDFDPATVERLLTIAPSEFVGCVLALATVARLEREAPGIRLAFMPYGNDGGDGRGDGPHCNAADAGLPPARASPTAAEISDG